MISAFQVEWLHAERISGRLAPSYTPHQAQQNTRRECPLRIMMGVSPSRSKSYTRTIPSWQPGEHPPGSANLVRGVKSFPVCSRLFPKIETSTAGQVTRSDNQG
jgi:hypothetical protein